MDSNKRTEEDLIEVKVIPNNDAEEEDDEAGEEKGDEEKGEKKGAYCRLKGACAEQYEELDTERKCALCGIVFGLLLLVLVVILVAACTPVGWLNAARIANGKFIVTHTACGPVQG